MEFHRTFRIWILSLCLIISISTAYSVTIMVGPGGPGAGYDYDTIQEGIDAAVNGDTVVIAPGVYTGTNNNNLDFDGKAITVQSTDPNDPAIVAATKINGPWRGFYLHSGEGNDSVISGLTISEAELDGSIIEDEVYGGGIYCFNASPTIKNCRIIDNLIFGPEETIFHEANVYGGGIACANDSHPIIINCQISGNRIYGEYVVLCAANAYGGGIYCDTDSSVEVYDSIITNNLACGGIDHAFITHYPFDSNGGGMYISGSSTIKNCLIAYNQTVVVEGFDSMGHPIYGGSNGAGIYCSSSSIISNCTIYGNDTDAGDVGVLGSGGGIDCNSPMVTDCIVWANIANEQIYGTPTVTYSDVQGGYSGTGNIDSDPCFVSGPRGDFYLSQIVAGQAVDSNCVDAGSDTAASLGMYIYTTATNQKFDTGIVDMGYHYPMEGSPDINGDYYVDFIDYALYTDDLGRNSKTVPKGSVEVDGKLDEWQGDVEWIPLDEVYYGNPNDVNEAKFALQWDPNTDKIYAAVIIIDTNHVFSDDYNEWDASDRIEIYSQGDDAGGSGWSGVYDSAQHYMVGPNTSGGSWGTWALGETLDGNEGLEYSVVVDGNEVVYEIGVKQFDNYGGFSGGDTIVTELAVGHVVRFDIVADTLWGEEGFGMLSENLMTGKFNNADKFARYMLVEQLGGPPCFERASDLDKNCICNFRDLATFAKYWLDCVIEQADFNSPVNNSVVPTDTVLSWSSGQGVISHDVYFSTNESDVINGTPDAYQGNIDVNIWDPCSLEPYITYFWRIDEVGQVCTVKGDIWSFTTYGPLTEHLVSWWRFDEGEGGTAYDSVGTNHGSITGASWTTGQIDVALSFDGSHDYVDVGDKESLELHTFTLNFWAQHDNPSDSRKGGIAKGKVIGLPYEFSYKFNFHNSQARASVSNTSDTSFMVTAPLTDSYWHMWTMTVSDNVLSIYKDGQLKNFTSYTGTIDYNKDFDNFCIGAYIDGLYSFDGIIDDVRFYYVALSEEDIWQIYREGMVDKAFCPYPENGADLVDPNVVLSWIPGENAGWHDVYFGIDSNVVNDATTDSNEYQGRFDVNNWDPCGLELKTTYYWRVDEVNDSNILLFKGDVWNFSIRGYTDDYLASWWKFDEGEGGIAYDSVGDNFGIIYGPIWTTGQIDGALSFENMYDFIDMFDKASLELQSFTLSFWAQHDDPSASLKGGIAKGKVFGAPYEFSYKLDFSNSQARASVSNTSDTSFTVTASLTDTDWHMWTMTAGDGILSIYKDGLFQDNEPYFGTIDYTKDFNKFTVGAYTDGFYTFDGIIDDVRFYYATLSEEYIWQLYQEGLGE